MRSFSWAVKKLILIVRMGFIVLSFPFVKTTDPPDKRTAGENLHKNFQEIPLAFFTASSAANLVGWFPR